MYAHVVNEYVTDESGPTSNLLLLGELCVDVIANDGIIEHPSAFPTKISG